MRRFASRGSPVLGAPVSPSDPPYMSGIIDELHCERRISLDGFTNVQSWTSRLGLYAPAQATAGQRPTYGVDGAFFNGKSVVQCDVATPRWLISPSGGVIFPANSRPYVATIARIRALPAAGFNGVFSFTNAGGGTNDPGLYANATQLQVFWPNASSLTTGPPGTNPVLFETYYDDTGVCRLAINLTVVASDPTPGRFAAGGATKVAIGANGGGSNFNNASFAFQRSCIALPPLPERQALYAWGQSYFLIP